MKLVVVIGGLLALLFGHLSMSAAAEPAALFSKDARILFQGDSITDGNRGRNADPNHILGHGYQFIIAAKHGGDFPELNLTFLNRGISGNKVTDLAKRWQKETLDLKPDLLSILIGVNDNSAGLPIDEYEATYDRLLADTQAANPKIKFILCEPFSLPVGGVKAKVDAWVTSLKARQAVVAKLAKKYDAVFVPFQAAFDDACQRAPAEYWIWDGVHPTYSGHQLMADAWLQAVQAHKVK
ncbi:MAG TPA: SGNH/GDSL hydrolase family protein [Pirellulaceae bacterium]|nr:SGNH/GDSL hydrolase family protein [Pirellulaceae bacterium]